MSESSTDNQERCSFCGKSRSQVKKLIQGPAANICNECVDLCIDIMEMDVETENENNKKIESLEELPKPKELHEFLNDYIISDKIYDLDKIIEKLNNNIETKINKEEMNLKNLGSLLHNLSPLRTLDRGYSIINKEDVVVNSVLKVSENDEIEVVLSDGSLDCTVNKINKKEV